MWDLFGNKLGDKYVMYFLVQDVEYRIKRQADDIFEEMV